MDYGAQGATRPPALPAATGEPKPFTPAPGFAWGVGGQHGNLQPPSGTALASFEAPLRAARRCFVSPRRKRATAAQSKQGKETHAELHTPCAAVQDHRTPGDPPYLRVLSRGTAPCPEHRPRPPLAVPRDPNNRPGTKQSRARSGTSPACSPPAPTSWRRMVGLGVPGVGGPWVGWLLPGTARKYGRHYLCREFDPRRSLRASPA